MNKLLFVTLMLVAAAWAAPALKEKRDVLYTGVNPSVYPFTGYPYRFTGFPGLRYLSHGYPESTYYEPAAKGFIYPHETGDIFPIIYNPVVEKVVV